MKKTVSALTLASLLALAGPLSAQELSEADLAALRYFISIGDVESTDAEIERLKVEFPGVDVVATVQKITNEHGQVDTTPIWQAIDADDYPTARSLIAEFEREHTGWSAPPNMLEVLNGREGQAAYELAYETGDIQEAIRVLETFPEILTCERINNPWRLAEMQASAGLTTDALETYEGVLRSCSNPDFVVATLQKSSALAERAELIALFEIAEARNPNMAPRFAELEQELFGGPRNQARATQAAVASSGGGGGGGGGAPAGLRRAAAAADRGDWKTCLDLTAGSRSLAMINQRAWCAFNFGRPLEALEAFKQVANSTSSASVKRDAQYGMSLAYAKLGMNAEAQAVASQTKLTQDQRRVTDQTNLSAMALEAFNRKRYREALNHLEALSAATGSLDRGMAMIRGWSLLKLGHTPAAKRQFMAIHRASPGSDTAKVIAQLNE